MTRNQMYRVLDAAGITENDQIAITDRVRSWSVFGLVSACRVFVANTHLYSGKMPDDVLDVARALMYC